MILNIFLGDKFGNMVPIYTFYEKLYNLIEKRNNEDKAIKITISTNNDNISLYKIYANINFSFLIQLSQSEKVSQLNVVCMGEIYKLLTGKDKDKYIEPDKTKKMNVFNLFQFMPFTSASIETLMILMNEKFINYRLDYMYKNVPIIDFHTNKYSNLLHDTLKNFYHISIFSPDINFKSQKKYLFILDYLNYMNNLKYFILPKLSNMNKIDFKYKIISESIIFQEIQYKQIQFLINTYDGLLIVEDIKFKDAENDMINEKLNLFENLIKPKDEGIISFTLLNYILDNYSEYVDLIDIKEVFLSTKIDIFNSYLKNKPTFYQYNFLLELAKNNIYQIIINQIINIHLFDKIKENNINNYGILLSKQLAYIDFETIKTSLGKNINKNKWKAHKNLEFNFILPPELT